MLLKLTIPQRDMILAALRLWQQHDIRAGHELMGIAADAGPPLTDDEIDELCEDINCGGLEPTLADCLEFCSERQGDEFKAYAAAAQEKAREGELEVDEYAKGHALVSKGDDAGAYVMAWLWVTDEEAGIDG